MCSKYEICGQRHLPKWRLSRRLRNRFGQFDKDRRLYKYLIIGVTIYSLSMIGVNTIWGWAKSLEQAFMVENTRAEEVITTKSLTETRIEHLIGVIQQKAKLYGVSAYQMQRTIECESRFNNVQSSAYKNGIREDSWGLSQIHLPSWPEVSQEEALTEEFAIEWMASHWNKAVWYGYSRKLDKCI